MAKVVRSKTYQGVTIGVVSKETMDAIRAQLAEPAQRRAKAQAASPSKKTRAPRAKPKASDDTPAKAGDQEVEDAPE